MTRQLISSGSRFEQDMCYSRAVVDGDWVFVAGTTGFDYASMTISDDVAEQTRQTFRNIEKTLAEAGCALADLVTMTVFLIDARHTTRMTELRTELLGRDFPASAAITVAGFADPAMMIEIQGVAVAR